jgi:hypothetical protein
MSAVHSEPLYLQGFFALPGILGVYTGLDLTAAGIENMPVGMAIPTADGNPPYRPSCPVLTIDKVRLSAARSA